jgi:hypothetical protein
VSSAGPLQSLEDVLNGIFEEFKMLLQMYFRYTPQSFIHSFVQHKHDASESGLTYVSDLIWLENLNGRGHSEDLDTDGMVIMEWIFEK